MSAQSISVIGGSGNQGFGLALRWAQAGHTVVIGSRACERAENASRKIQDRLGPDCKVEGKENTEAVAATDLVVLTVPFEAQIAILKSIRDSFRPGQTLVDVTVPLETAVGGRPAHLLGVWSGSAAEQAASNVPEGVEVVAAFHNISASVLENLDEPVECDVIVCGESSNARAALRPWVEAIPGCRYVNGGKLENARIVEAMTALLIGINVRHKVHSAGIRITGLPPDGA